MSAAVSLISLTMPAIAMGNRVVAVPSAAHALIATDLYQVLETSDVPGGVFNIVTGERDVLAKTLAEHDDVDRALVLWRRRGRQHGRARLRRQPESQPGWRPPVLVTGDPLRHKGGNFCNAPRRSRTSGCHTASSVAGGHESSADWGTFATGRAGAALAGALNPSMQDSHGRRAVVCR